MTRRKEFIRKNIRLLGFRTDKSFRREDKFEYPIKALREAIINGLIHRDYYNPADVRVFIFDDRVEIVSPGSFPQGVTSERPEHKPVNKVLSKLMYDIGYIEKYGSGIYLENELCLKNGNEKPVYEISSVQTKVIFKSQVNDVTVVETHESVMRILNERQRRFIMSGVKDISSILINIKQRLKETHLILSHYTQRHNFAYLRCSSSRHCGVSAQTKGIGSNYGKL